MSAAASGSKIRDVTDVFLSASVGFAMSKAVGLAREVVIAGKLGVTLEADIYSQVSSVAVKLYEVQSVVIDDKRAQVLKGMHDAQQLSRSMYLMQATVIPGFVSALVGGVNGPIYSAVATTAPRLPRHLQRPYIARVVRICLVFGAAISIAMVSLSCECIPRRRSERAGFRKLQHSMQHA